MKLTGNDLIEALKAEDVQTASFTAADQATIDLDPMFSFVQTELAAGHLVSGEVIISGDDPISLRLESNLINLPVRYVNAIGKIEINEPEQDVNLYMIVEHPHVSHSGLRIDLAASVAAALDDFDSVAAKVAAYYDEKLALIQANILLAEEAAALAEAEAQAATDEEASDGDDQLAN